MTTASDPPGYALLRRIGFGGSSVVLGGHATVHRASARAQDARERRRRPRFASAVRARAQGDELTPHAPRHRDDPRRACTGTSRGSRWSSAAAVRRVRRRSQPTGPGHRARGAAVRVGPGRRARPRHRARGHVDVSSGKPWNDAPGPGVQAAITCSSGELSQRVGQGVELVPGQLPHREVTVPGRAPGGTGGTCAP